MKFIIFFVLLALVSCHISFTDNLDWALEDPTRRKDDAVDFLEGLFSHFNLSSPSQIKDCFCDVNAGLYFKLIEHLGQILEDTKERNSVRLHLEIGKLVFLAHSLKDTHACIFMTQDFTDLLDALKIDERNPYEFKTFLYIYYQAHYNDLFEGFQPVLDNLNSESHNAAGDAFGAVLNDTVKTIYKEGLSHVAYAGFVNGAAISLDIDDPDDSLKCYDNNSSHLILEFTYKLAEAVTNGNYKESPLNAWRFMAKEGKDILNKIPKEDYECDTKSEDYKKFVRKIGMDLRTEEFHDLLLKYIYDHRFQYYVMSKSLKKAFDHKNLHHAGSIHAQFLQSVASSA